MGQSSDFSITNTGLATAGTAILPKTGLPEVFGIPVSLLLTYTGLVLLTIILGLRLYRKVHKPSVKIRRRH
ncbi:hypothetical protein LSI01_14800 [Furfurilactobacillus siliginis]|uniref:Uncharacterized protein n=2 Tax=Furfurilactobacillus siliginis TaxID=348151 RepID=A0A510VQE9_9LACO|nr:hypothetical protein LSI01_14800 [Furfurilactobacillus siliginis]